MKNPMQLKAIIKNKAKEANMSAQLVMQNYLLERLLERIAQSDYRSNLILKGGFLIASMVGLDSRATMDMDVTLKGMVLNEEIVRRMFKDICSIKVDDPFSFTINGVNEIREGDTYTGYRISLTGNYPPMAVPLKVDITTGDRITPKEMSFTYKLMFEDTNISILAYNLETILAEKLETIISRGNQNTRPRDFYDVYILGMLKKEQIDFGVLSEALKGTAEKRKSTNQIAEYHKTIQTIRDSRAMNEYWLKYQKDFAFAEGIEFNNVLAAISEMLDTINEQ